MNENVEASHDGSWYRQTNGRDHADKSMSFQKNRLEQNGYNAGVSRSSAYDSFRRQTKTTADLDDFESDPWPPAMPPSIELTPISASLCSNSSSKSAVAPLSPGACVVRCLLSFQCCKVVYITVKYNI